MKAILLTSLAILAFAANSILCRMALGGKLIDAASFTTVRLVSGAIMLMLILILRDSSLKTRIIDFRASAALFIYAICFSFAYIDLSTGTGALILFGTVQLTIIVFGILQGDRPKAASWAGVLLASSGLVYLVLPGVSAPSMRGTLLMFIAGLAWGVYSVRGKGIINPLAATTWNFIGTIPLAIIASLFFIKFNELQGAGILLAIASGALASGIGYAIWYAALPYLNASSAASVQLSVPMIAAFGGVIFMAEPFTTRLTIASIVILGGIALVINANRNRSLQN